jgi:hypothetical protein
MFCARLHGRKYLARKSACACKHASWRAQIHIRAGVRTVPNTVSVTVEHMCVITQANFDEIRKLMESEKLSESAIRAFKQVLYTSRRGEGLQTHKM